MQLLVFFDLPVITREERKMATRFRNFLVQDGYHRLQLSVYSRLCRGQDTVDKHLHRLNGQLPHDGCVRVLQLTDRQYGRMRILVGKVKPQERIAPQQLLLF
jgi:CRISPR-associated protein Cas2